MPPARKKKIDISIKSEKKPGAPIPAMLVAEKFQCLQNLLYVIGDFLEGNKYRTGGDFPTSVKTRFTLVVSDLKMGSLAAQLSLADNQQGLPHCMTLGEQAISLTKKCVLIAQTEENISNKISEHIPDEPRKNRIIQELVYLWPDNQLPYIFEIGLGQPRPLRLDPQRKPVLQQALHRIAEPTERTIIGRVIQLRVDKMHECRIDTPEGEFLCKYRPDMEKTIINNIGSMVSIIGLLKDNKIELTSETAIEKISSIQLKQILFRKTLRIFKDPLIFEVQYESDEYILSNEPFHILVVAPSLKQAIKEIEDEVNVLWEEYVDVDTKALTKDAIEFRSNLKSIFAQDGEIIEYA
jgi:hypothetical protein